MKPNKLGAGKCIGDRHVEEAHLINELTAELVVLLQHLVPQITVHALHDIPSLDLEQAAAKNNWSACNCSRNQSGLYIVSS